MWLKDAPNNHLTETEQMNVQNEQFGLQKIESLRSTGKFISRLNILKHFN